MDVLFCLSSRRYDRGRVKVSHETGGTPVNGSCRQSKRGLSNKWKSDDGGRHFYKNTCPHRLDSPTISLNNYVNEPRRIVQLLGVEVICFNGNLKWLFHSRNSLTSEWIKQSMMKVKCNHSIWVSTGFCGIKPWKPLVLLLCNYSPKTSFIVL